LIALDAELSWHPAFALAGSSATAHAPISDFRTVFQVRVRIVSIEASFDPCVLRVNRTEAATIQARDDGDVMRPYFYD
jgi:hypothetical protein